MSSKKISIALVDDHPLVRSGVSALLSAHGDMNVVAEAGTVEEGIEVVREHSPDVAILDLRLPDGPGLDIARWIADNGGATRCVVLTSVPTDRALVAAYGTGAVMAFQAKDADIAPLIDTVREVAAGRSLLDAFAAREAMSRLELRGINRLDSLNERELQVAGLVSAGYSDSQVAEKCIVSLSTVRNALSSVYSKLDVDTRTQLVRLMWIARADADVV